MSQLDCLQIVPQPRKAKTPQLRETFLPPLCLGCLNFKLRHLLKAISLWYEFRKLNIYYCQKVKTKLNMKSLVSTRFELFRGKKKKKKMYNYLLYITLKFVAKFRKHSFWFFFSFYYTPMFPWRVNRVMGNLCSPWTVTKHLKMPGRSCSSTNHQETLCSSIRGNKALLKNDKQ